MATMNEAQPPIPFPVFDFHLHALPMVFGDVFGGTGKPDLNLYREIWHGETTEPSVLDATLEQMDQNNVKQGILSGSNKMVQAWVEKHPDRFIPAFIPDLTLKDHQAAAERFEQEVEQGKWQALGELMMPYEGRTLNDPVLYPYYRACERHGLPVMHHCGLTGPNPHLFVSPYRFRVELGSPLFLQDVIEHFPNLKIVIYHMGWPMFDQALYMLYAYPNNVYLDTGVVDWVLAPSVFNRILREAVDTAPERVLFGSDQMIFPEQIGPAVNAILSADFLSDDDKRKVLWDNAASLLNL